MEWHLRFPAGVTQLFPVTRTGMLSITILHLVPRRR